MKHLRSWFYPTLTIEQSSRMAKLAYDDEPQDIYTWKNICKDPYLWAVEGFETSHTIFVVRGTAQLKDWTAHNLLAVIGTSETTHFETAYEKVTKYLNENPKVKTISFVGHSMGAHLSDLLAARMFKEAPKSPRNIQVKYVRMFDSNGSKASIHTLYEQNHDLIQLYLESVKRVEVCGAPNIVNLAGEHLSQVQYLKKYGQFNIDLVHETNNFHSLLNSENSQISEKSILGIEKHSISSIATALENEADLWNVEHWGVHLRLLIPLITAETMLLKNTKIAKSILHVVAPNNPLNDPLTSVKDACVMLKNYSPLKDYVTDDYIKQQINSFVDDTKKEQNTYQITRLNDLKQSAQNAFISNPKYSVNMKYRILAKTLFDLIGYAAIAVPFFRYVINSYTPEVEVSDQAEPSFMMQPNHPCIDAAFPESICPLEANASLCSTFLPYN